MCKMCRYPNHSTKHLLYWQAEWFKRFLRTWYHIFNRKAYVRWVASKHFDAIINSDLPDDGKRIELNSFLRSLNKHE